MTHQIKAVGFDIDADESLALRARADILASQLNLIVDNVVSKKCNFILLLKWFSFSFFCVLISI